MAVPYHTKPTLFLDRDDGLEHEASSLSPYLPCMNCMERKVTMQELHAAIASPLNKQAKRIYAHFILVLTKTGYIARRGRP